MDRRAFLKSAFAAVGMVAVGLPLPIEAEPLPAWVIHDEIEVGGLYIKADEGWQLLGYMSEADVRCERGGDGVWKKVADVHGFFDCDMLDAAFRGGVYVPTRIALVGGNAVECEAIFSGYQTTRVKGEHGPPKTSIELQWGESRLVTGRVAQG